MIKSSKNVEIKNYIIENDKNFIKNSFDEIFNKNSILKPCFLTDNNIWQNCQKEFIQHITKFNCRLILLDNPKCSDYHAKKLLNKIKDHDFVIALGSGTINDLCKYVTKKININFVIFASAASMNGYLSNNCSILINNHKKSINCLAPIKVYCDINIIKNAPINMIKAGIGDILCFYNCYFDWLVASKIFGYELNQQSIDILQPLIDNFIKNYDIYNLKDDKLYYIICEILMVSAISMNLAGGSMPVSQGEHIIAHLLEMKYQSYISNLLHGEVIAITSIITSKIQGIILKNISKYCQDLVNNIDISQIEDNKDYFDKITYEQCCVEYNKKVNQIKLLKKIDPQKLVKLKSELKIIYSKIHYISVIYNFFEIDIDPKRLNISENKLYNIIKNAKYIRNRLTCLDFDC
tara:strand:+ start:6634 stop:7854 length:1221 start_codon:yes stop_codon:yes gene_type:complete